MSPRIQSNPDTHWSEEEMRVLSRELWRFTTDSTAYHVSKCVKIAALLPEKLTRDVAQQIHRLLTQTATVSKHKTHPSECRHAPGDVFEEGVTYVDRTKCTSIRAGRSPSQIFTENDELLCSVENANIERQIDEKDSLLHVLDNLVVVDSIIRRSSTVGREMPRIPVRVDAELVKVVLGWR
ncbi:MAG: hypothetical protein CMB73_07825 [Euryarchaeota archaeon]|jgi:hypothetical protein|nr:hypothetical protein [Euryarchaeota archaeon]